MEISFIKLHGLGNDFVFIDGMNKPITISPETVQALCDRHFGIGGDGVVIVQPSPRPECRAYMHYINSDGTLAEMCGNGIRCFTKFLVDNGYLPQEDSTYIADTKRGPLAISYQVNEDGTMNVATVDMDAPILNPADIPTTLPAQGITSFGASFVNEEPLVSPWGTFTFTLVSMGNPHAVCFIDDFDSLDNQLFATDKKTLETLDLTKVGAFFESHPAFPAKANIEFAYVAEDGIHMRVFERGCGETLACGTGACATLVAANLTHRSAAENDVILRGGTLHIEWRDYDHVLMTGPATCAFTGSVIVPD